MYTSHCLIERHQPPGHHIQRFGHRVSVVEHFIDRAQDTPRGHRLGAGIDGKKLHAGEKFLHGGGIPIGAQRTQTAAPGTSAGAISLVSLQQHIGGVRQLRITPVEGQFSGKHGARACNKLPGGKFRLKKRGTDLSAGAIRNDHLVHHFSAGGKASVFPHNLPDAGDNIPLIHRVQVHTCAVVGPGAWVMFQQILDSPITERFGQRLCFFVRQQVAERSVIYPPQHSFYSTPISTLYFIPSAGYMAISTSPHGSRNRCSTSKSISARASSVARMVTISPPD